MVFGEAARILSIVTDIVTLNMGGSRGKEEIGVLDRGANSLRG